MAGGRILEEFFEKVDLGKDGTESREEGRESLGSETEAFSWQGEASDDFKADE